MDITQIRVAPEVIFFSDGLYKKWNLKPYQDINKPCIFFGVYNDRDIQLIKRHVGFKIIWFTNTSENSKQLSKKLIGIDNLVMINDGGIDIPVGVKSKKIILPIKDFSGFKPTKLGDKIYCYIGNNNLTNKHGYPIVKEIEKRIDFEIIYGKLGNSISYIKDNYYDKCFLNINISDSRGSGMTTLAELGYMGRYTISNTIHNYPCVKRYKSIDDIVEIINEESKKIGTIQPSLMEKHFYDDTDWLNLDFWK